MEIMSIISLIVLVGAIVVAFLLKINTGVVAIASALILGLCAGWSDKQIMATFGSKLFLTLLGVMFLFGIAQENKTLDLLAKKALALCRGRVNLFPPLLFLVSAVLSAIGPGLISVTALMSALTVTLARQTNTEPIRLIPFGVLGSFAGGLSPLTPSGIVAIDTAAANGITGLAWPLMWQMALTNVLYAAILYFVFKWHTYKHVPLEGGKAKTDSEKFSPIQWMTLGGILLVAVLVLITGVDVGMLSFAVGLVLLIFKAADDGAVIKKLPWGTLVMISGVGILISVVTELGGIDLLSEGLKKLMNTHTAAMIYTAISGVMSWVSSASGVVMPTMIPTVPGMVQSIQGIGSLEMVIGICIGAHLAALSPLSSCGGLMLAAYSSSGEVSAKDRNRVFVQLFVMSACGVAFGAVLALLGLYG